MDSGLQGHPSVRSYQNMRRDVFKFLSGLFAGFAIEHAVTAIYLSAGVIALPVFLGRQWPNWSPWIGAVFYAAVSVWLGYLGWRTKVESKHDA